MKLMMADMVAINKIISQILGILRISIKIRQMGTQVIRTKISIKISTRIRGIKTILGEEDTEVRAIINLSHLLRVTGRVLVERVKLQVVTG